MIGNAARSFVRSEGERAVPAGLSMSTATSAIARSGGRLELTAPHFQQQARRLVPWLGDHGTLTLMMTRSSCPVRLKANAAFQGVLGRLLKGANAAE